MKTLHLFAGAGGGIIADMMLGNIPLAAVEIDPFCRSVLKARQDDGSLPFFPIFEDVRSFDGSMFRGRVDCISGGFPCQDVSIAGNGAGIYGAESRLFFELARVVRQIRPKFIFLENSPLIISRGIDSLAGEMVALGYCGGWLVLPASAVGALHKRERWFGLFADSDRKHGEKCSFPESMETTQLGFNELRQQIPYSLRWEALRGSLGFTENFEPGYSESGKIEYDFGLRGDSQSRLGRVVNGLASGLDGCKPADFVFWSPDEWGIPRITEHCKNRRKRLISIGNGQVPACAAVAFLILFEMLKSADLV